MGVKFDEKTKTYVVSYSKRHPKTNVPKSLRRKGIKTKAEANRVYAELIVKVEQKLHETVVPKWESLVEECLKHMTKTDVSIKTVENYGYCLKAHTYRDWGHRQIDKITAMDIRTKVNDLSRSESHRKNLLKYIRGAFTFAVETGYLPSNPTPRMKFKVGDKLKTVLTETHVQTLLNQAKIIDCEWYPIWAMALYTGMRNGELYALTWDKVNLESRQIKVDCSWNKKDGFKDTKSGDDRIVGIAPDLLYILQKLKIANDNYPFVLPRIDKWDKGYQAMELHRFLEGVGLPRIRFHDLRATWATIMLSKGIPPIKVMVMGGWKDLKTMQHYVRKAGVNLNGITDNLALHNPHVESENITQLFQ